ncbi:MAG: hypothetical protein HQK83_03075 [Fibrobacteria bacterium]|nr:hypothetical protein [Fibrobacteria bacterium]
MLLKLLLGTGCTLIVFMIYSCKITSSYASYENVYQSDNFIVYYDDEIFSEKEVIRFTVKKERMLTIITSTLEENISEKIVTNLINGCCGGYTRSSTGEIYEYPDYVPYDKGHEIVHAVVHKTLDRSLFGFFREGMAEALEVHPDQSNAIERFFKSYASTIDNLYFDKQKSSEYQSIYDEIVKYEFDYSYFSYMRAGAFVQYLINEVGTDTFKTFYNQTATYRSQDEFNTIFSDAFGKSLETMENEFIRKYSLY